MKKNLIASLIWSTAVLALPATVWAQDNQLEGVYVVRNQAAAQKRVAAAIERTVAEMSFLIRGFARDRLTDTNRVCGKLTVKQPGTDVYVRCDNIKIYQTPANGSPKRVTSPDGDEKYKLTQKVSGNRIVQLWVGEEGQRKNTYQVSADGKTLTMTVVVSSSKLDVPLKYKVTYGKK